jgi:hypothetical protein
LVLPLFALFSFLFSASAFAEVSSRVALTPRLAKWKSDIEATGKTTVVLTRVYTDTARNELQLPADAEFRPSLEKLLSRQAFTTLFIQTFAMNVNLSTGIRPISVVLLNMARSSDWEGEEEAVIAHEFGHIWLHVNGYPALDAVSRLSCETVHASDIVQHVLIRDEMRARQIDYLPFWLRALEEAFARVGNQSTGLNRCDDVALLALWMDVSLGLSSKDWPRREEFLAAMEKSNPDIKREALAITRILRNRNLRDRGVYQRVLRSVLAAIDGIEN